MDELRTGLELATEEELQQLTQILFARGLNPLDYWQTPASFEVQNQDYSGWLDSLEERFRYLAADGMTVLQGRSKQVSYRQALIQVCQYLKVSYSDQLSTTDIESEIFLYLISKAWQRLPASDKKSLNKKFQKALVDANISTPMPVKNENEPLKFVLKGGGVLAVNSVLKPWLLQQIARQFALHFASYQTTKATLVKGGAIAASKFQNYVMLQSAKRGMAITAARYGMVRTVFAFIGPVLWTCLLAELGWKTIATNYSRIIPVIFTLAQIRLTRTESWQWKTV